MKRVELAAFNQSELCILIDVANKDKSGILEKYEEVKCATQLLQTKQ